MAVTILHTTQLLGLATELVLGVIFLKIACWMRNAGCELARLGEAGHSLGLW
jgi:hypothetical protein